MGEQRVPVGPDGRWTLRFYGPRGSFPTVSLQSVLDRTEGVADKVAGRIVWLGATATAVGDTFVTPFDPALPGVEAFATATANLLTNTFLDRGGWVGPIEIVGVLLVGLLTLHGARLRRGWLAITLAPLPILAWTAGMQIAFVRWTLWLNWTVPVGVGVATLALVAAWRVLLSEGQRRRLASYLPEPLIQGLSDADRPAFAEREQYAAVLFVDLVGFTNNSEAEPPAATAARLKRLHALVDTSAHAHAGYVDNFAGDGAMLVFGVPEPRAADPANALACARDLLARAQAAGFGTRIGVHYGIVQLTIMGGRHHSQVSLAGDTVNVASRLMDVAKAHDAVLAVSQDLARGAAQAGDRRLLFGFAPALAQKIRGRTRPVDVHVLAHRPAPDRTADESRSSED
jgi:adenylate cyclase